MRSIQTRTNARDEGGHSELRVSACGAEKVLKLVEVYYATEAVHSLTSYGKLDKKGFTLTYRGGQRVVAAKDGGTVAFDIGLRRNVLVVCGEVEKALEAVSDAIMTALDRKAGVSSDANSAAQKGPLVEFHRRLGYLNYDAAKILRGIRDPGSRS